MKNKKRILIVFGTRPEAIKMAPLINLLKKEDLFESKVCVTAQHREMLDQVMELFQISPDYDLDVMQKGQSLESITSKILIEITTILKQFKPNLVLVHGDTSTTFSATLASYYQQIPVGHIEAGLRTGDIYSPWPEEVNRKFTGMIAKHHFAPTEAAKVNLLKEGIKDQSIAVTGNTVVDSLLSVRDMLHGQIELVRQLNSDFHFLDENKKLILITGHRRESFGDGFQNICNAIKHMANKYKDLQFVYPVHLNPNVQNPVKKTLGDLQNVYLISPQHYLHFTYLMDKSHIILTDSGGIQEEAPSLGKPVLVMRDNTERPEAVEAGTVKLVGTSTSKIIEGVEELLYESKTYNKMSRAHNPYGDGKASQRIIKYIKEIKF
jgi:UDP-N-acetylglucosamine 2-epimerase (non-hydrolysing)